MKCYLLRSLTNGGFLSENNRFENWGSGLTILKFKTEAEACDYGMNNIPGSFEIVCIFNSSL
jgi:hypothetical protein